MKKRSMIIVAVVCVVALSCGPAVMAQDTHHEWDVKGYDAIAKSIIGSVIAGNIDVNSMMNDCQKLVEMGVEGCEEHMGEPETPADEKKLMQLTIDQVDKMVQLTLEEIEAQWHDGGAAKTQGIDLDKWDHFAEVCCHYDAVVHPATCVIALKAYSENGDEAYLDQIQDELAEVREHLKHLD